MAKAGALIRLGHVEGNGKGREIGIANSQYFHLRGGHFVFQSPAGGNRASLCASGAKRVLGWLVAPKQDAGKAGFKSAGNGVDKGFVIMGYDDVFAIRPNEGAASMAASWVGKGIGIVNTGATYGIIQKVKFGSTASPLAVVDVDTTNKICFVKIKAHQPT